MKALETQVDDKDKAASRPTNANTEAIYMELPWLINYTDGQRASEACVGRLSNVSLEYQNVSYCPSVEGQLESGYYRIHLVDKDGTQLIEVGCRRNQTPKPCFLNFFRWLTWSPFEYCKDETVSDALVKLGGESGKVSFVVVYKYQGFNPLDFEGSPWKENKVIILKKPKHFTLENWHDQMRARIRSELAAD